MDHPSDETLGLYIGGVLNDRERAALEAHVGSCQACARMLEELVEVDRVLGELPALRVPVSLGARVRARLLIDGGSTRVAGWRVAAAVLALLVTGGIAGAALVNLSPAPAPLVRNVEGPKFALFFAEDPQSASTASPAERQRRMDAFLTWMYALGDTTVRLGGSELDDTRGRVVGASTKEVAPNLVLSGFLVVRASTYAEAEAMARRCPIVTRGGQVIVRQLR